MQPVIRSIFAIQHRMNPLHVYCRFMDRGYARKTSVCCCRLYEFAVFSWVRRLLSACLFLVFICSSTDSQARPSEPWLDKATPRPGSSPPVERSAL